MFKTGAEHLVRSFRTYSSVSHYFHTMYFIQ